MKYDKDGFPKGSYIFQEIGGVWRRVDSQEPKPPTLAEFLKEISVIIDDYAEFVRIRQPEKIIYYRVYGGKIAINIHTRE